MPENRGDIFCIGPQIRTDFSPHISQIPHFRVFITKDKQLNCLLVVGKKYRYSISGAVNLYGRLDTHGSFVISFVNPCH